MIGSINTSAGGHRLALHLDNRATNETVRVTRIQGLVSQTIAEAMAELQKLAKGARAGHPLVHAVASPHLELTETQWEDHWSEIDSEFGLCAQPFVEVEHRKIGLGGRVAPHRHRIYLRIQVDRRAIPIAHAAPRCEKVSRITEFAVGEPAVSGRFNRTVIAALRREGRHNVADHLVSLGFDRVARPVAASSSERQQAERNQDLAADEVWARAWRAWMQSHDAVGFIENLQREHLLVAQGDKGPVVVSPGGSVASLRRAVANGASRAGAAKPRQKDIIDRLRNLELPTLQDARRTLPATFDPGICGHVGDNRWPLHSSQSTVVERSSEVQDPPVLVGASVVPEPEPAPIAPSPAQQAALDHFMDMLSGGAALAVRAAREDAAAKAKLELNRIRQNEARKRVQADVKKAIAQVNDLEAPTLSVPSWRDSYKAELAGLPADLGALIRWVERRDSKKTIIHLANKELVETSPGSAISTGQSAAATAIMIAHARKMGWPSVHISGGTAQWRTMTARRLVRAGVAVANSELQKIAAEEAAAVSRAKRIITRWKRARQLLNEEPDDQYARRAFLAMLQLLRAEPLGRELMPRRDRFMLDFDLAQLEKREYLLEGTSLSIEQFETYALGLTDVDRDMPLARTF